MGRNPLLCFITRFIFSSGLIIRNIGLEDKELSPVKVAFKLLDDKSPVNSLTPVPEFPKYNSVLGSS